MIGNMAAVRAVLDGVNGATMKLASMEAAIAPAGVLPMLFIIVRAIRFATPVFVMAIESTNPVTKSHKEGEAKPLTAKAALRTRLPSFVIAPVGLPTQK